VFRQRTIVVTQRPVYRSSRLVHNRCSFNRPLVTYLRNTGTVGARSSMTSSSRCRCRGRRTVSPAGSRKTCRRAYCQRRCRAPGRRRRAAATPHGECSDAGLRRSSRAVVLRRRQSTDTNQPERKQLRQTTKMTEDHRSASRRRSVDRGMDCARSNHRRRWSTARRRLGRRCRSRRPPVEFADRDELGSATDMTGTGSWRVVRRHRRAVPERLTRRDSLKNGSTGADPVHQRRPL